MADTGVVGVSNLTSGQAGALRLAGDGSLVVAESQGRFVEGALRGRIYHAMTTSAGVSIASLTFGTAVPFALYNPAGSGYYLGVLKMGVVFVSGTMPGGQLFFVANVNPNAAAVTGTAITVVPGNFAGTANNVGKPLTTATLPANGLACGAVCTAMNAVLGSGTSNPFTVETTPEGMYLVAPGCSLSVGGVTGTGSSPLAQFACSWIEIPTAYV